MEKSKTEEPEDKMVLTQKGWWGEMEVEEQRFVGRKEKRQKTKRK